MSKPRWQRVVLKISGEAFAGPTQESQPIDASLVNRIAIELSEAREEFGVDLAIVVGGGNIWRGLAGAHSGMDRATADYMGMLATVINALALQDALERVGQPARVQSAIDMAKVAEPYIRRRAMRHLEKGRVVILAGGGGIPFFSTDTTAALRSAEIEADIMLKGTHGSIDGIYDADPRLNEDAKKFSSVSFSDVINKELRVMDLTATTLCKENNMPIYVFNVTEKGNIARVLRGEDIGTLVS